MDMARCGAIAYWHHTSPPTGIVVLDASSLALDHQVDDHLLVDRVIHSPAGLASADQRLVVMR